MTGGAWDALGRVKTIANELGTFTTAYSTSLHRVDSVTGPNSVISTYAYFPNSTLNAKARQLQSITHSRLGTNYSSHTYDYDIAGRMTSWLKTASPLNTAVVPSTNAFGYNLSDEVTSYDSKNTTTNSVLDAQTWA